VKPLHLNLASRPYRDNRIYVGVIMAGWTLVAALAYMNFDTYLRYRSETGTTRAKIALLEAQATEEERRTSATNDRVKRIDLVKLTNETKFVNTQLAEHAFSWSELLDRLEVVLPEDVRVRGLAPNFEKNGRVHLNLQLESKNQNAILDTLNALTKDTRFTQAFPTSDVTTNGVYTFSVSVDYKPTIMRGEG
jgi:Tfp pilus assembly protein PilN